MSGSVEQRLRSWQEKDCQPICPSCYGIVDILWWESGHATCGNRDCVETYVDTFLQQGWEWDGLEAIPLDSGANMSAKPEISRETTPSGAVVLTKKGGTGKISRKTDASPSGVVHTATTAAPAKVYEGIENLDKKQVFITPQCWWDLQFMVRSCPIEISGLGIVKTTPQGLMINRVHLLKQDGGGAHTELDPEAIAQLMMEVHEAGEDTGDIRFWWHSHPMSKGVPTPSGRDHETFASFGRGAQHSPDWYINAIFSSTGESYWRMDLYRPVRTAIMIQPTMWHPSFGSQDWEAEMKDKISRGFTQHGGIQHSGVGYGWPNAGFGYGG